MGHRTARAARIGVGVGVLGALLTAMAVAAGAGANASTVTASLSIAPPSQTVDAGDTVTVDVSINNVVDMAAWEFVISYNPAVLDYTGAAADKTMLQPVGSVFCPGVIADEVAGKVTLSCGTFGNAEGEDLANGADGSGKLGAVSFAAKAAGKSPIVFTKIELARADSTGIAVTGSTGMVCVDACSGVEPTPTYNPALLTPTAVSGGSQYDPVDEADPNAPAGGYPTPTPRAGTSRPVAGGTTGGGGSTGGTTSGTLAGSTVRSGSGSAPGVSGATDGNGFPVAGTGAGAGEGGLAWPAWIIIISGSAGLALLSAGALTSRRGSA